MTEPGSAPARSARLAASTAPIAVVVVAAVFALRRVEDFDTWWHLASGRWILAHGAVPHTDVLSHTVTDHPWINLQWLYDVVVYGLYRAGGADLLVIAAALSFTTAVWLMIRNARVAAGPLTASAVALFAVLFAEERFLIRPEMFSFIFLEIVLWLLLTMRRDDGARLWLLPLVMVVWVNCHALFVIGSFVIAAMAASAIAARFPVLPRGWRRGSDVGPIALRRLLLWGGASFVAVLVNPYFFEGASFPLELLSRIDGSNDAFQVIGEFRGPFSGYFTTWSIGAYQSYFFASVALAVVAALVGLVEPRPGRGSREARTPGFDVGGLLVFAGLAYLSYLARRNLGLFAFGTAPIVAAWLAQIGARTADLIAPATRRRLAAAPLVAGPLLLTACAIVSVLAATNRYYRASDVSKEFGLGIFETNFPIHAAAFAEQTGLPGKMYNDLTAGGYLTWHGGVAGGVFIDGRLEVYDTEFFTEYLDALNNPQTWQQHADRFDVQTVFLFHRWGNRHGLIRVLASDPRWTLAYYDEAAIVFVRTAGNAGALKRVREAFPEWQERTLARLAAPPEVWGLPIERATALESWARLLSTLGALDEAVAAYERLLALDVVRPVHAASIRFGIGVHMARKGELAGARRQLELAAELDPGNDRITQTLARLRASP